MSDDENIGMTPRQRAFLRDNPDVEIAEPLELESAAGEVEEKPFNPNLVGIGGWLAAFIALFAYGGMRRVVDVITITTELDTPAGLYFATMAEEQSFLLKLWAMGLADFAVRSTVIFNLWQRKEPRSVLIAIAGVWALGPVFGILLALLYGEAPSFYDVLSTVFFSAMWTAYFLTSKRVAATYNASRPEVAEIFK